VNLLAGPNEIFSFIAAVLFGSPLNALLFFMVTTPLVGWISRKPNWNKLRDCYVIIGFSTAGWLLFGLYNQVTLDGIIVKEYFTPIGSSLAVDRLSLFMATAFILLGLLTSIYAPRYMEHDTGQTEYHTLVLGMTAGMVGVVFAADFLTFFIFWELMSLTSYVLVAFRKERWAAIEASYKYFIMSAAGTMIIAYAMSLLYGMTGTLNFAYISVQLTGAAGDIWIAMAFAMILIGFAVKAAIVPVHTWLPDAHPEAPSPVSALLSGVLITTGVYGIARVSLLLFSSVYMQWQIMVAVFSIITMTVGNFTALLQNDVKRMLAYSSIANMGYALIGVAAHTNFGYTGALLHLLNHALMKGLAFLCAGAFIYRLETRLLKDFAGIRKTMPLTTLAFCISLFALIGFPPFNGFISKYILFTAAIAANWPLLAVFGAFNTVVSAGYFLRVTKIVLLDSPTDKVLTQREAPATMLLPIYIMVFLIVLFGVYPGPSIDFAQEAAASALDIQKYLKAFLQLLL